MIGSSIVCTVNLELYESRIRIFQLAAGHIYMYSQTCIKRSPLGQRKNGLIRQVTS